MPVDAIRTTTHPMTTAIWIAKNAAATTRLKPTVAQNPQRGSTGEAAPGGITAATGVFRSSTSTGALYEFNSIPA